MLLSEWIEIVTNALYVEHYLTLNVCSMMKITQMKRGQ